MEPVEKVSAAGNKYTKLVVATSNGMGEGKDFIWNVTIMAKLRDKLPQDLFKKFAFAKFNGLGTHTPFVDKKTNAERIANDLFCDSVTLPDGTIIYQEEKKVKGENEDEDAPF